MVSVATCSGFQNCTRCFLFLQKSNRHIQFYDLLALDCLYHEESPLNLLKVMNALSMK